MTSSASMIPVKPPLDRHVRQRSALVELHPNDAVARELDDLAIPWPT